MILTPFLRKLALTVHLAASVGWLGAVAAFLALAVVGLTRQDIQTVRAAYVAMALTTWFVIVPLAFASLLSGVISSLGTRWGLFRYYWVVIKLLITLVATIILLVHTQLIDVLGAVAAKTTVLGADLQSSQLLMVVASVAALLALLMATALSVYKPQGMTRYGARWQHARRARSARPHS